VAQALRDRDPLLGVGVRRYAWYVERVFGPQRGAATIAAALGGLALLLAVVGMFGVFSYWVEQRRRDIGIRVALGATRAEVLRMLLVATGRAVGWGLVVGVILAVVAAQTLRSSLYGLPPLDPTAFALAISVLIGSALLATLWPAWSALRVSPLEAIRSD
jgi:putative ABC transport system permease protein